MRGGAGALTGLDLSPGMLKKAAERDLGAQLIEHDMTWPVPSAQPSHTPLASKTSTEPSGARRALSSVLGSVFQEATPDRVG